MKTYTPKVGEVKRNWHVVDASCTTLGRLATQISIILRGKNKPTFAPHMDTGDFVVVVNAKNVGLTGKKKEQKMYTHYTGFPGGMREVSLERMLERKPEDVIRIAVRRMLPDNKLSEQLINKLKIYPGLEHPHAAQDPKPLNLGKKGS
jgi:large subunit ribosomal protein L13